MKLDNRAITLSGIGEVMFDRYPGDNKTQLPPERKFYFARDGKTLILPSTNIMSMLSAQNTDSATKRFLDKRKYKETASAILSYVTVSPFEIPFAENGSPIVFDGFSQYESGGKFYVHQSVARLAKGVPNPKIRPVMRPPWELKFEISIFPNQEFTEDMLHDLFVKAGIAIGIGTFRGVFGKFQVTEWKNV